MWAAFLCLAMALVNVPGMASGNVVSAVGFGFCIGLAVAHGINAWFDR